jgi:hypothetical protein
MAYYTALINEWALLTPGTTAAKLAQINAMTVSGSVPTVLNVTGAQLLNCINYTEFKALTAAQQQNLLLMCNVPGQLLGGSSNVAQMADGMLLDYFTNHSGPTIVALTALAQATVQPWWQANGYTSPITQGDLTAAGGLV